MRGDTKTWLNYSRENLESAIVLVESKLFNPCLQNVQQCVEKALKSIMIENSIKLEKTHSISELKKILNENGFEVDISKEECEFLDSIYIPSKYPTYSVLPYYDPDLQICNNGISLAEKVLKSVQNIINGDADDQLS